MNAEGLISAGGLSRKLITFLVLMLIDIFFSSYVIFIDMSKKLGSNKNVNAPFNKDGDATMATIFSGVQVLVHFCLIFWYFFLIWKTFMFRFGQIRKLVKFFPVLYLAPLNSLAFFFERALRYYMLIVNTNEKKKKSNMTLSPFMEHFMSSH